MTIRAATTDDAPAIADIVIACWRVAYRGILPDAELDRDTRDERAVRIRRRLDDGWPTFIAVRDAGCIGVARLARAPRYCDAELEGLYVHPDAQRDGLGRALVAAACRHAASLNHRSLYITTLRDNRVGRPFYEKLGGRLVDAEPWSFANVAYPAVGYVWDDLTALVC